MGSISSRAVVIPMEFREVVAREVPAGEKVLWFAAAGLRAFMLGSIALVLFAIPWTGFAIFWVVMAWTGTRQSELPGSIGTFFPLFGIPFILVGLGMLTSPFWLARKAKRTCYILTERRAIVVEGGILGGSTVTSFQPERLTAMRRTERKDGSGDLVFEQFTTSCGSGTTTIRRGFMGIDNVREVEGLVNQVVNENRAKRDAV